MSYIGKVELKASDIRAIAPGVATAAQTDIVLSWLAPNVQSLIVTINGVKQQTNSYTIAGSPTTVTLSAGMTLGDDYQVIGINDIGTTIVPADGTVTLPKISAGTGSAGQYLKTDGASTLSWGTVASTPDLTTEGDLYKNYKEFTSDHTTPVDANSNSFLLGPIGVSAVGSVTWTIEGDVDIL